MLLKNLIKLCPKEFASIKINNLCLDSRKLKRGDIFFALKGHKDHGEKYIKSAIDKKASIIISENKYTKKKIKIPFLIVKDVRKTLTYACSKYFSKKPKNIIAVTGTNGKSSVADYYHQILKLAGKSAASIGTLGIKINNKFNSLKLTTPNIIEINNELEKMKIKGIENIILEASSHGLIQNRLDGIEINTGIFTNFSQDHLDYHKSMKNYFNAKMILFKKILKDRGNLISDSKIKEFKKLKKIAKERKLKLFDIKKFENINFKYNENILGNFQRKNLLMAIIAATKSGLKLKKIKNIIPKISSTYGRLQLIKKLKNNGKIFIDYAHTPDALENVLITLKHLYGNKIKLVFGCGGDRDIGKRKLMAKVAKKYCKKIYVTDDNPREENPKKIRDDITKFLSDTDFVEIGNRKTAIKEAIRNCEQNEIILIAGKGHENYQDYGKKKIKFSDKSEIKKVKVHHKKTINKKIEFLINAKIMKNLIKKENFKFKGVSINSKDIKKNNLFIALSGKKYNAEIFVNEALRKGANYCVVSKKFKYSSKKIIKVSNPLSFLRKLSLEKRKKLDSIVIGITGSAGKTSLKSLLGNLLNIHNKTYYSPLSYNNHIGVPLSLSNLEVTDRYGVFEIGMSKKGEIKKLSKIVNPDIGIITNVGPAHIENFRNIKEIAKTKGEIINNIKKDGSVVLNRDDKYYEYLKGIAKKNKIRVYSFGMSKKANVFPLKIINFKDKKKLIISVFKKKYSIVINDLNIHNVLCSYVITKLLKLDFGYNTKFFNSHLPLKGRGKTYKIKRFKKYFNLIDESYNSNPLSADKALKNYNGIKKRGFKKYLLLGDMLELGRMSDFYHSNLAKIINKTDIDKVFIYGDKILKTYKNIKTNKQGNILQFKNDFDSIFSKIINKSDYLLIKGSNGTGLHKLCQNLIKGKNVI